MITLLLLYLLVDGLLFKWAISNLILVIAVYLLILAFWLLIVGGIVLLLITAIGAIA